MKRPLMRIGLVVVVLIAIFFADRTVDPPIGRGDALLTEYSDSLPLVAAVPLPGYATGFSVFLGVETDDMEYPRKAGELLDRLLTLNVNTVSVVFSVFQEGPFGSEVVARQGSTPSDAAIQLFIRAAQARGIAVILRPTLDEENLRSQDRWRGQIEPDNVDRWFETYGDLLVHYAEMAQTEGVAAISAGVEFESMEQYHDDWHVLIDRVRGVFSRQVTYSYNFQRMDIGFADALDFVGLDAYYPLDARTGASVADLDAAWAPALAAMLRLQQATNKPVMLTEVGVRSEADTFMNPFESAPNGQVSQEDQRTYYESLCNVISTVQVGPESGVLRTVPEADADELGQFPVGSLLGVSGGWVYGEGGIAWQQVHDTTTRLQGYMANSELAGRALFTGAIIWFAYINAPDLDPETDTGYAPLNKLAEPVIADCFKQRLGNLTPPVMASPVASPGTR